MIVAGGKSVAVAGASVAPVVGGWRMSMPPLPSLTIVKLPVEYWPINFNVADRLSVVSTTHSVVMPSSPL